MAEPEWRGLARFTFGDSRELADKRAGLVLASRKTATCWPAGEGPKTRIGQRWGVLDGDGGAVAIIETIALERRRCEDVDAAFAFDEGEGDRPSIIGRRRIADIFPTKACSRRIWNWGAKDFGWSCAVARPISPRPGRRVLDRSGRPA